MNLFELKQFYNNTCRVCNKQQDPCEFTINTHRSYWGFNKEKKEEYLMNYTGYSSLCHHCKRKQYAFKEAKTIIKRSIKNNIGLIDDCNVCRYKNNVSGCHKFNCFDKAALLDKISNKIAFDLITEDIIELKALILKFKDEYNFFYYYNKYLKSKL